MCHLGKWCSHFYSSHSQMLCQDKGPSADSRAMPWCMTRVAKHLVKSRLKGKSSCDRTSASLLAGLGWVPPTLDHGRLCSPCQASGLAHCLIFPLTQVSSRIFSWNKNLEVFLPDSDNPPPLTSPIVPTSVSLINKTCNTLCSGSSTVTSRIEL